jgi:hypothetical protein
VLLRANLKQAASKEKFSMSRMTFYAPDATPSEVARFYLTALSTPWHVAVDQDSKERRTIIYKKLFERDMKIILIERRLMLDTDHHATYSSGSIIGTADVDAH